MRTKTSMARNRVQTCSGRGWFRKNQGGRIRSGRRGAGADEKRDGIEPEDSKVRRPRQDRDRHLIGTPVGLWGFESLAQFASIIQTPDVGGILGHVLARLGRDPAAFDPACRTTREEVRAAWECSVVARPLAVALDGLDGFGNAMTGWRDNALGNLTHKLQQPVRGVDTIAEHTLSHLGDVLHAVPMLKALRGGKPATKIVWLVGSWSGALVQRYAGYLYKSGRLRPTCRTTRTANAKGGSQRGQMAAGLKMRRIRIDVFIGPMDGVGRFLANAVCPRLWTGVGDGRPSRVRSEITNVVQPYKKDRFEENTWCGLLEPLGVSARTVWLEYKVTLDERRVANEFLKAEGVDRERPLALNTPGSGLTVNRWLPVRFGEIVAWLVAERKAQIAWIGGPEETGLVSEGRAGDFRWFGKVPIWTLAAALPQAPLFVGNDSGLLHFAAAKGVPTVSVWGLTNSTKWGFKESSYHQIRKKERCDGCILWDYRATCRYDRACMKAVVVGDVQEAIADVWKRG